MHTQNKDDDSPCLIPDCSSRPVADETSVGKNNCQIIYFLLAEMPNRKNSISFCCWRKRGSKAFVRWLSLCLTALVTPMYNRKKIPSFAPAQADACTWFMISYKLALIWGAFLDKYHLLYSEFHRYHLKRGYKNCLF
jgi:hypothetical protein